MPDIVMGVSEQIALRKLLAVEQPPSSRAQRLDLLEQLSRLIRCDAVGMGSGDETGLIVEEIKLPRDHLDDLGPQACDGPLPVGLQHWSRDPVHADLLAEVGLRDSLSVSFRSGSSHVVQVYLDRFHRPFDDRDAALLGVVGPVLARLFRDLPTVRLPSTLTVAERRVLQLVATGLTNGQVAERLFVAPSTVRKHLENAYRKLEVPNRVAAIRHFQGWVDHDPEPPERTERLGRVAAAEATG